MRAAIAEGDLAHTSRALSYINTRSFADQKPPEGAIASAAEASGLIHSAGPNRLLRSLSVGALIAPKNQPDFSALGLTPPNLAVMFSALGDSATETFVHAVDAKFPPDAILVLPPLDGRRDEVVLGIALSTLRELLEQSTLARFPELQIFINETLRRIHDRAPALDTDAGTVRSSFGTTDASSIKAAVAAFERINTGITAKLGQATPATQRLAIGAIVAQLGYNAAVFRDADFASIKRVLPQFSSALSADDPLQPTLSALAACDADGFVCQRKAAVAFVAEAFRSR